MIITLRKLLLFLPLLFVLLRIQAQELTPIKAWEGKKEVVYSYQLDNGSILLFERSNNYLSSNENIALKMSVYNGVSTEDLGIDILTKSTSERINMLSLGNGDYLFTIRDASLHLWKSKTNIYKKLDILADKSVTNIYSMKKDGNDIFCVIRSGESLYEAQWNGQHFEKKQFLLQNDNPNQFRVSLERTHKYRILSTRQQGIMIIDLKGNLIKKINAPDLATEKDKEEAAFYFRYMQKYKGSILCFAGHRAPSLYILDTVNFEIKKFSHQFKGMGNHLYLFKDAQDRICIQNDYSNPRSTEFIRLDKDSIKQATYPRIQLLRNSQSTNPANYSFYAGEFQKASQSQTNIKHILPKYSIRYTLPLGKETFLIGENYGKTFKLNAKTKTVVPVSFYKNQQVHTFFLQKKMIPFGESFVVDDARSFLKINPNKKIVETEWKLDSSKTIGEIGGWLTDGNNIYFGRSSGSIYQYNITNSKQIAIAPKADFYTQDLIKEGQRIFAATSKGLKIYDVQGENTFAEEVLKFDILKHSALSLLSTKKYLWIGTDGKGLIRWDRKNEIKTFGKQQGLHNERVIDIIKDGKGRLWASTMKGVYILENEAADNLYAPFKSQLSNVEFNRYASFRNTDGQIFLGGLYGLYYFHENDAPSLPELPRLYLNYLEYYQDSSIQKSFIFSDSTASIHIPVEHKYLNVSLSQSKIGNATNHHYFYRLNNTDWKRIASGNILALPYLPPGNQVLHIKGIDEYGRELPNQLHIRLDVEDYFYKSWWFLGLLALILGGITYFWIRRLRQEKIILEERVKKRTATIEEQKAELKSLDDMKNRFFSNISHELRTPLTLILSPLRKIFRNDNFLSIKDADRKEIITVMHSNAELLNERIEELLDLSRISSNTIEVAKNQVNLKSFLHDVVNIFSLQAKEKEHVLHIKYNVDESVNYIMDSKRIKRIIQNLVGNAIKYSPKGSNINVSFENTSNNKLEVQVEDNGLGINQKDQDKVFDRFFQVSSSVKTDNPGTGIGLAMVKEYVELLNGTITLESAVGKGSLFTVLLPLEKATEQFETATTTATIEHTEVSKQTNTNDNNKPQLLFAEDNNDLRKYISGILSEAYNVTSFADGAQAWASLQENKYDIILSDIMMPEMDGLTLLEKVRSTENLKNLPFVFLTAKSSKNTKIQSFNIGLDDYVVKPFEEEELLARLHALYTNYKTRIQSKQELEVESEEEKKVITKATIDMLALDTYITQNIADSQFSIENLAKHLGLARRTLDRKLKIEKGMTSWQYVKELQLNIARRLHEQESKPIQEIADQIGIRDAKYFRQQYKERFGSEIL